MGTQAEWKRGKLEIDVGGDRPHPRKKNVKKKILPWGDGTQMKTRSPPRRENTPKRVRRRDFPGENPGPFSFLKRNRPPPPPPKTPPPGPPRKSKPPAK